MNKSTPISQLPSTLPQPSFVSDQQKQMITNAQAAIQTMNLPQNTQTSNDIVNDDDPTIQELLNQLNQGNAQQPATQQAPVQFPQMPSQVYPMLQNDFNEQFLLQQQQNILQQQQPINPILPGVTPQSMTTTFDFFFNFFADDIKIALIVFAVVVSIHFIPVSGILSKYIAIDKVPYHDVILKGLLAACLVIITKKVVFK